MKRYALLDTDFISKTHSVQDDGGNHLIDRVMELPEYEFFCHAQIVTELNRYNADTPIWLSEKIGAQKIKSYTDQEILESLSLVRGPLACATYTQMLKLACDAFSKDYFSEHYQALEEADYAAISREDYLKELERLDIEVGKKNNLGEIKSFVLLQVLSVMLGEQIYVFCSDDKNARNGATNFEDVRCISLVSVLLFSMDILSAGQCAVRNGSAFIPDEAVAGNGSTSNADRRICDFYDSAGGWQRGCVFGTGGSNDSASMVHIRR